MENESIVADPRAPLETARQLIAARFTHEGMRVIHAWRGDFRSWTGTHYPVIDEAAMRATVYEFLETAVKPDRMPFNPTASAVTNVVDALRAAAHLDSSINAPAWLDGRQDPAAEYRALKNGLLHLPTRKLINSTPAAFVTTALPFDYNPRPPRPTEWLRFLESLWPDDDEAIATLQEIFGYMLSNDTRQQKIPLIVGPKRSGKGTIARVLRAVCGQDNVAGPTLSGLAGAFGLQGLIDKPVAIISDARLSTRTDQAVITERLLSISGEDGIQVDRKHRDPWNGQLPTRFLILTNELPRLTDTSGALASRFLILTMSRSWYGQEDLGLEARLLRELPGIFNWSLDGYDRLRQRGHFQMPKSSEDAVRELTELSSPVGTFVSEHCVIEPGAEIETSELYGRWRKWCEERGQSHTSTEAVFGRDLRAAVPGIKTASRRSGAERWRAFVGIRLRG